MGAGPGKAFKAVFVWTLVVVRGNQIRVGKEKGFVEGSEGFRGSSEN